MKLARTIAAVALLGLVAATPAAAVTVLAAPPQGAACDMEAGCMTGPNTYVRVIPAGAFAGGQNIASLLFDRSILEGREGAMIRLTFWVGGGEQMVGDFGSFVVSVLPGQEVMLGGDDFWYDPAWGDLMIRVDIAADGPGGVGGGLYSQSLVGEGGLDTGPGDGLTEFWDGDEGPGSPNGGPGIPPALVMSPNPEPGAWALMIAGFGGAGAMLRRQRRAATA